MTIPIYVLKTIQLEGQDVRCLLSRNKHNWLVSFYLLSGIKDLEYKLEKTIEHKAKDSIFILDSGAYSAWLMGIKINLWDYINFIKKYHSFFTHIVALDVIDNPVNSEVNHLVMRQELADYELTIIPVFHSGESFSVLDYMIEQGYKYIGISPNNSWKEELKQKWLSVVMSRYDFDALGIKTHGFGYTSINGLTKYPLTTADSIAFGFAAGHGELITKYGRLMVSNGTHHRSNHIGNLNKNIFDWINEVCFEIGLTLEDLATIRESRLLFNIESIDKAFREMKPVNLSSKIDLFADEEFGYIPFNVKSVNECYQHVLSLGKEYKGYLNAEEKSIEKPSVS
jgi:hypothetical protein